MNEKEMKEMKEKILKGITLSFKRLVEQKKKANEELIFADSNGTIFKIKAKDLKVD